MCLISKTNSVTPIFFTFLAKVDLYLTVWQVLKKSVRGNILGANVHKPRLHVITFVGSTMLERHVADMLDDVCLTFFVRKDV